MATDKLINHSQGDDIINALDDIATSLGNISYGEQTSSNKVVAMTGYQKASTAEAITQADTLNEAVGKLEKKVDDNATDISDKVDGPNSATVGNIATFNNVNGKSIDDSGISVETSLDNTKDTEVPTSKAVDTYITDQGFAKGVSSSTANHLVTFNGTDGKALKDSGITVATSVTNDDTTVPTSKAVQTYAAPASHTHSESEITDLGDYAGSNEKGGAAKSANKLNIGNSDIGSATQPVYFDNETGLPVAITNTIQSNVPANAVFTDTTYQFDTGTANGKIKVKPSNDTAYEVSVYGLKSAAYTESSAYATSGHTHDVSIAAAASGATANVNLSANTIYTLTAGGKTYNFKTPVDNNSVTGVKGNSESSYRTGQVNITAANIGLGNVGNFKAVSTVASQGLSDTEKSNARANIGAAPASLTVMGFGLDEYSDIWLDVASLPVIVDESSYSLGDFLIPTKVKIAEGEVGIPAGSASYGCNINHIVSLHVDVRTIVDIAVGSEQVIAYVSDPPYGNRYHIYPLMLGFYSGTPIAGIQCYMRGGESCVYVKPLQSAIPKGTNLIINGTYLADNSGVPPLPT